MRRRRSSGEKGERKEQEQRSLEEGRERNEREEGSPAGQSGGPHHEGVGLRGEGAEVCAADADAELDGAAGRVRQQRLGHVAHDALGADVLRRDRVAAHARHLHVADLLHLQAQVLALDGHQGAALAGARQRVDL